MTIGIGDGERVLLMIAAAVLLLPAFIASIVWVWRDAERRGQPGFIVAVLVTFLFWPFSLIVWLLARPQVGATPTAGRPLSSHEGIITLSPQVGATPTAGRQRGVCGVVLLVVLLGIGLITVGSTLVGLGLPMIVKIRSDGQRETCLSQVKEIAIAYLKYQDDNGRPPEYLAELGLRNLRCPSGTQSGPSTDPYELLPSTEPTDIHRAGDLDQPRRQGRCHRVRRRQRGLGGFTLQADPDGCGEGASREAAPGKVGGGIHQAWHSDLQRRTKPL